MKVGAFLMPSHPPEKSIRDGQLWDLHDLQRLDALGFHEAWIGEHFTAAWEPCPAPDLLIAQALQRTKRIRLGPLGHLLPYHNPIELAHRRPNSEGSLKSVGQRIFLNGNIATDLLLIRAVTVAARPEPVRSIQI